ncbi:hypothetical protein EA462_06135 [Natrarchaeobius halalkaliphilus]|uniref:Uncharacterized protein n=1 Tax=Natrarchaeobius halalkaliphilus TaxID=1679091 RepID=A0A3N6MCQ9_9EURY|nr:hypothetical protein EA462_06135 [Natrarchaeobius halalkaliphilus]
MLHRARDGSILIQAVSGVRTRVRAVLDGRADDRSSRGGVRRLRTREAPFAGSRLVAGVSAVSRSGETLVRIGSASKLVGLGKAGKRAVESSFVYGWLTAEPEPDVIVIDLRETWTVGPAIRVVDRIEREASVAARTSLLVAGARRFASSVRERPIRVASLFVLAAAVGSLVATLSAASLSSDLVLAHLLAASLAVVGLRSRASLDELLETRIARALGAAFGPPEPPESARDRPANRSDRRNEPDSKSNSSRQ